MLNTEKTMEKIVALCKGRGFIFAGSDIYGGLANTWDYGPLGARLKNNVKDTWRKRFIQERKNSYEVDADILMHPRVWEASGHVASFSDPLLDCKECKMRHRADNLIDDFDENAHADGMTKEEMFQYIKDHSIPCPNCGKHNFTDIREFNLMFQTFRGVTNNSKSVIYLRPENAQGEDVNYLNVQRSMRAKLPFSIGQIGKAFRNEITPGNFTFRTIEFEQMEFQTFCKEGTDTELYDYFKNYGMKYYQDLGICALLTEGLELHLLELDCSEGEVTGCDFVSESLTDLTDAEGKLCSHRSLNIEIVYILTLSILGTEIDNALAVVCNTSEGLEHKVEFTDICEVVLTAVGARN